MKSKNQKIIATLTLALIFFTSFTLFSQNEKLPIQGTFYVVSGVNVDSYVINGNTVVAFIGNQAVDKFILNKVEGKTYYLQHINLNEKVSVLNTTSNTNIFKATINRFPNGDYLLSVVTPENKHQSITLSKKKPSIKVNKVTPKGINIKTH